MDRASAWELLFGLDGRLIFSEREAGVGVYFGSLPRAEALSIGTPAGSVDKRAERFFLLFLHHFMFTDCVGEGESVVAALYSRLHFW